MKLLTKAIVKKLPPIGSQDGLGDDAIVHLKLFNPTGAATWLILEYDGADTFFGFVNLGDPMNAELGYISLKELTQFRGKLGLGIERDLYFEPVTLREAKSKLA